MSNNELNYGDLDALGLAALIRKKEITALELVDESIRRCESVNGTLNAVITKMFDHARDRAKKPLGDGPFAGVPFLMKDFVAEVAGVPFYEGSDFLSGYIPIQDSEIYRRFCHSGLITIGKTNLPEFAIGVTTEPRRFGATHNPWDPKRTPGGSSGGAAAAVAARIVPIAHGNDVGGSIRIPASCCGLVGLKPTRGRTTLGPHYGDIISGYFVEHGLTRSVRDAAALLDVMSSPQAEGEPYLAPAPARSYLEEIGEPSKRLKIGFSTLTPLGDPLDPECEQAILDAAELCTSLGHEVVEASPKYDALDFWTRYTTVLAIGVAWAVADWGRRLGKELKEENFEPFVWAFTERGRSLNAPDYLLAVQDVQHHVRHISQFYVDHDLWLTTTLGQPPVELGTLVYEDDPFELRRRMAKFSPYTYIANATGQPAISLPLYWSTEGLPIGLHFTARCGEEVTLIRLAADLERALPWDTKKPQICT
ncbi:MAG TPA: amidase [Gammaproteobacteria bacterium]|nr:amidase [Gammaproteobacteria bacterium]|tara:strand:- start:752 stop:2188 length:1437 start_codon:yes stop_codon:yes gene_type:complete